MESRGSQAGFSLVELMVAMTVTLIVSGAIYGLLAAGGNAFKREPEIADRQQNIRMAIDLISRDVFNAGAALPPFAQVFTANDPDGPCVSGLDGCGMAGAMGADNTDVLEMVGTDERCPVQTVCCDTDPCTTVPGAAGGFVTREEVPQCLNLPGFVTLTSTTGTADTEWFVIQPAAATTGSPLKCEPGGNPRNGNFTLGAALAAWPPAAPIQTPLATGPPPATPLVLVYQARIVRYRIAASTDPQDTAPALWRSTTGRYFTDGTPTPAAEPGEAGFCCPREGSSPWEIVARGIEDLQVQYLDGTAAWTDSPPVVTTGTWTTLVRQVRITLSARANAMADMAGETTAGGTGPNALRGQLTAVVTPRAAFNELQMTGQLR